MSKGIGGHQRPYRGETDCWLTPPEIIQAFPPFDLDPCSLPNRPWDTALQHYFLPETDGLTTPWHGRVWLNPPYGPQTTNWLALLASHGDGIALIFARTETRMFFEHVWNAPTASAILFLEGRLYFYRPDGTKAPFNSGAPSCLVAYGVECAKLLFGSVLHGKFIDLRNTERKCG
jgi:hypothetical protein